MVGAGRERAKAPSSSARGLRSSIPDVPLRRALLDSMSTPPGPSSSTAVPSRGRGRKRGGGARGRGRGGRVTARAPSSPPPPAVSPEHVTARVDSSEEEATRTPVHEPPVHGSWAHDPRVDWPSAHESSAHETPEEHTSGWGTWPDQPEEPSGHADDGGEPTDLEEEGGTVYQRGATRLPSVPATREQRWLIFPDGERYVSAFKIFVPSAFTFLQITNALALSCCRGWDHHHSVRRPNSVLGVLCRQNFPGFVTLPGEGRLPELGLSWEHYVAAPAPPDVIIDGVVCDTRADMVIRTFWTFYRCEEGYEEDCANVIENVCKRLLQNLRHEARVQAVRDYYALRGIKKTKPACRDKFLSKEQYMKAPPRWCADRMDCWEVLVDEWCSQEWLALHNQAKDKRAQMEGVPHHQGSSNLYQFGRNW
ncbi:uncharacterized protein, partial [Aegilops tauschii subsp. strangulata]|uniref:uncharacterized protein n=1 Tax=Aegilops tauschii subsp. strangulata TaxID=200361 RepID=UPI003CC8CCC1